MINCMLIRLCVGPRVGLVLLMGLIFPLISFAQEKEFIPDGTQGEQLEVLEADTVPKKWKDKRWRHPYYWAGFVIQGEPR